MFSIKYVRSAIKELMSAQCCMQYLSTIEEYKVGTLVEHTGCSSYGGLFGIVTQAYKHLYGTRSRSPMKITWVFDKNFRKISNISWSRVEEGGIIKGSYKTTCWATNNLRRLGTGIINPEQATIEGNVPNDEQILAPTESMDDLHRIIDEETAVTWDYILWSPQGDRNPKQIHSTEDKAKEVALLMAIKHNQQFYVCKLVAKSTPRLISELETLGDLTCQTKLEV
jgi:hypothetical protein